MLNYGDKSKFENTAWFGLSRNLILTVALIIIVVSLAFVNQRDWSGVFILIFGIPISVILSGIYNGIVLMRNQCPLAARINRVLAIASFVLCGSCTLMLLR